MSAGSLTTVLDTFATYGSRWFLSGDASILSPNFQRKTKVKSWKTRLFGYQHDQELGSLATSFMGVGNEAIVCRSASQQPDIYGPDFHFEEYIPVDGLMAAVVVHLFTKTLLLLLSVPFIRWLMRMLAARMDTAPDINALRHEEKAKYHAVGEATGKSVPRVWASFSREGALYELTALVTCVGAKVLLDQKVTDEGAVKDLRGNGGFVTPSFLGLEYVGRLKDAGIKIEVGVL
jgi:short subunit dehydrogenase-like uncharacterized protein